MKLLYVQMGRSFRCWLDHITLYRNSNTTKGKHPFSTFPAGGYASEFVHQMFCICCKNLKACKLRVRMHATNMTHIGKNNYEFCFTRPYMKCRALVELSIAPLRATDIHSTKGVSTASINGASTKDPSVDCILLYMFKILGIVPVFISNGCRRQKIKTLNIDM